MPRQGCGYVRDPRLVPLSAALAAAARDLVLAESCAGCSAPRGQGSLCSRCRRGLLPDPRPVRPLIEPAGFPRTVAAAPYTGVVRRLLVAHKEQARLSLARPLGLLLAAAVAAGLADPHSQVVLVPVPSQRGTTRRRGHDPVQRMARHAARCLGAGASVDPVLRHRRRVDDQSGLTAQQRLANLTDALEATRPIGVATGAVVVLVDDICSSGSTLAAAAAALGEYGVVPAQLVGAVVASPPLRVCA